MKPIEWNSNFGIKVLHALRILRLELCYGSLPFIADLFLRLTGCVNSNAAQRAQ